MAGIIHAKANTATDQRQGAWRVGDHPGQRQFATLFSRETLQLECGQSFGPITLAYETWGQLNSTASNAILLLHGFSGDSHAAGGQGPGHHHPGWWNTVIGPGLAIDTNRFFVICPSAFGSCHGSTGPASLAVDGRPYGSRFPVITIRDMVATEKALAEQIGINQWYAVIGGSMGGMRALEWAIDHPSQVERLLAMATCAAVSAEVIALHATQIQAIELDPDFKGGNYYEAGRHQPQRGLCLARSIARISYGSGQEFDIHFDRRPADNSDPIVNGCYAVEAYLLEHSEISAKHLDANSYRVLTRAMSHHDIGRGRGGITNALAAITARTTVVSIASDRLFPPRLQNELAQGIKDSVTLTRIDSLHGHDGFLCEQQQISEILRQTLDCVNNQT